MGQRAVRFVVFAMLGLFPLAALGYLLLSIVLSVFGISLPALPATSVQ